MNMKYIYGYEFVLYVDACSQGFGGSAAAGWSSLAAAGGGSVGAAAAAAAASAGSVFSGPAGASSFFSSSTTTSFSVTAAVLLLVVSCSGFVSSPAAAVAGSAAFSSVTINVETFSNMKKTGPGTEAAPNFDDASLAAFDPGNSVYIHTCIQTYILIKISCDFNT